MAEAVGFSYPQPGALNGVRPLHWTPGDEFLKTWLFEGAKSIGSLLGRKFPGSWLQVMNRRTGIVGLTRQLPATKENFPILGRGTLGSSEGRYCGWDELGMDEAL